MFFKNYNELELDYIFEQTLSNIIIKQNNIINFDIKMIKIPNIKLYFVFNELIDIDLSKYFDHIILLWLIIGKRLKMKKISNRLHKGKRYYKFVLFNNIKIKKLCYDFLDFLINGFFHLLEKNELLKYNNLNNSFFEIKNLEVFSNLRLTRNYYTGKVNDKLILKFYNSKNKYQKISIDYILNLFKIRIKEKNG